MSISCYERHRSSKGTKRVPKLFQKGFQSHCIQKRRQKTKQNQETTSRVPRSSGGSKALGSRHESSRVCSVARRLLASAAREALSSGPEEKVQGNDRRSGISRDLAGNIQRGCGVVVAEDESSDFAGEIKLSSAFPTARFTKILVSKSMSK